MFLYIYIQHYSKKHKVSLTENTNNRWAVILQSIKLFPLCLHNVTTFNSFHFKNKNFPKSYSSVMSFRVL